MPKDEPTSIKKSRKKERKKLKGTYGSKKQLEDELKSTGVQPEDLNPEVEAAVGPSKVISQDALAQPTTVALKAAKASKCVPSKKLRHA